MPPKVKFTKEEIVDTALSVVREGGMEALTARSLAAHLGSSAKPIFGYFSSMEELQSEVMIAADRIYNGFITADMQKGEYPPYKASGMAYIRFAREETTLFKLLFMRDRRGETITEDREAVRPMLDLIMKNLGIDEDSAYQLHLELWIYVHGIATMFATAYLDWNMDFVSRALTDLYEGLKYRFGKKESEWKP